MKKLLVALLDVEIFDNGRKVCETLKNGTFNSTVDFRKQAKELDTNKDDINENTDIVLFELTEFMDACNSQDINLENFWVTYIHIK